MLRFTPQIPSSKGAARAVTFTRLSCYCLLCFCSSAGCDFCSAGFALAEQPGEPMSFGTFRRKPFKNGMSIQINVSHSILTISYKPRKSPRVTKDLDIRRLPGKDAFEVDWTKARPDWGKSSVLESFVSSGKVGLLEDKSKFWLLVEGQHRSKSGADHSSSAGACHFVFCFAFAFA